MTKKEIFYTLLFICILVFTTFFLQEVFFKSNERKSSIITDIPLLSLPPTPTTQPLPQAKTLENNYHVFQTFNNCGPAALSMALSYYGINKSQQELGQDLRPYQNIYGNNDDKSVTLDELSEKVLEYNLIPLHRPNGSIELIKQFIVFDIPVITRTRLVENDDIGHYRVIKGYDDTALELVQDDSLQGHNLKYSYAQFMNLWQMFNYEYLVLVPPNKEHQARIILGEDIDEKVSWKKAVTYAQKELDLNPDDVYARFNLSVALYHVGDYGKAIVEFEKVENSLPFRTLWYQIEPIQAYFKLGYDKKVFDFTEAIFNNQNKAFSELYSMRGEIYKKQGNIEAARKEFELAVFYNQSLTSAHQLLRSVE